VLAIAGGPKLAVKIASEKFGVLVLCDGIYPDQVGGAEIHVFNLACRLADRGHNVYVITPANKIPKKTSDTEIPFAKIPVEVWPRPFVFLSYIVKGLILSFKLRKQIGIVHSHTATPPTMITAFLFSFFSHKPYVVACMGSDIRISSRKFLYRAFQLPFLQNAKSVVVVSKEIAVLLKQKYGIPKCKILVVGSSYDDRITQKLANTRPHAENKRRRRIISVANMRPEKDHTTLLKAFAILVKSVSNVQLYLVGNGLLKDQLEEFCIHHNLNSVRFLGRLPHVDALEYIANSDIFILTSVEEGMPTVILEALALGKPVIATAVGGIPEIVKDGINGILVPPKSPEPIAKALDRLLSNSGLRRKLGRAAAESVKDYAWSKTTEKYEEVYSTSLEGD
jgi:glycosyltransferase involved in cell wall biosynthesis